MPLTLGYYGVHDRPLHASDELTDRIATLLTDRRWPWQPALVRPKQLPGRPLYDWPSGKVPAAKLHATIRAIVRSNDTTGIKLVASRQQAGNHAWIDLASGQADAPANHGPTYPFDVLALCRAHGLPVGKRIEDWLELMHELSIVVDAANAVIWASDNELAVIALLYGTGSERPDMVVDAPRYEIVRVGRARRSVGAERARPPAWGTYLKPAHVRAIGGRERIVELVRPPVLRDVGSLLYVQLSERVAAAQSPETQARWRAFLELLEPITVPRLPR